MSNNNNNEPIYVRYNGRRKKYYCERFGTPFHNNAGVFLEWDTAEEAVEWAQAQFALPRVEVRVVV